MKHLLKYAKGLEKSELVLKNCQIVNVYSGEIEKADIAIHQGVIVGVGHYEGEAEHDLEGMYVAPGLIDGHVHIESSMVTPSEFAKLVVPKGTTTVISDPHEIANVSGVKGIEFMLDASERLPLNVYVMIPSCVPATKDENSGAIITVEDIIKLKKHPRVLGLGEVMDYPATIAGDDDMHNKINAMRGYVIDGHAPDIMGKDLNAYGLAGVMTDHECTKVESMIERVKRGFYVHLREGSATRNTETLLRGVNKNNFSRLLFCTDDKHPEDILNEGHINYNVNLAIKSGVEPIDAIKMATLNAATCYGLNHLGGIAPGKMADLIVFKYLNKVNPVLVYKQGVLVANEGQALFDSEAVIPNEVLNTVKFEIEDISFDLKLQKDEVKVIGLIKNNITTEHFIRKVKVKEGLYVHSPKKDILKLAVIERHHNTKNVGIGLVEGFGKIKGAIAMTIAHDSHNLVIVGSDDHSMKIAAEKILEIQGGIVIVENNKVVDYLQLEVAGIMTNQKLKGVQESLRRMKKVIVNMGLNPDINDPFTSIAFLALPVIPKLKLTDRGLFDVEAFQIVQIEA